MAYYCRCKKAGPKCKKGGSKRRRGRWNPIRDIAYNKVGGKVKGSMADLMQKLPDLLVTKSRGTGGGKRGQNIGYQVPILGISNAAQFLTDLIKKRPATYGDEHLQIRQKYLDKATGQWLVPHRRWDPQKKEWYLTGPHRN